MWIANKTVVPSLAAGQWQLSAPAVSGKTYLLQYSTNLTTWHSIHTNQAGQALSFVDAPPSAQAWRYYRSLVVLGNVTATTIAHAVASNSYLPNVVGFVNVSAPPGFSLMANPFNTANNTLAALLPNVPNGTQFAKYITGQGYVTNLFSGGSWSVGATTLNPGEGGFFDNPATTNLLLSFSGQVWQGKLTNSLPAGYAILSPMIPLGNALATLPVKNGDSLECYIKGKPATYTRVLGVWSHSSSVPPLTWIPGEAFLMKKISATNWVESFSVSE